jgi:hypothetical protein|tara:strand:+ start:298 stop:522 length:225 start_codon:yes stop_codon:yes gene_type:complete
LKIVRVDWIDAQHPAGEWVSLDTLKGPLPVIQSAGFLVHEDRHKIVIAVSADGNHVSGEMTIPKVCIRKRKLIR